jgi:glutamate/tyrosine decarboxylase-like PLP-dependent enzyme
MYAKLEEDRDRFPALLQMVARYAADTVENVDAAPVALPPQTLPPCELSAAGIGAEAALRFFMGSIAPSLSASTGPRHLGFVTGGATPAAVIGDWLATLFDQNPVSRLDGSTALQIERDTIAMLRSLLDLPDHFAGTLVSGATMSNFVGLAVAREWAGRECGVRVSEDGVAALPRLTIFSATPHSSSTKALSMLGLGRRMWREVNCLPHREAMDVAFLDRLLDENEGPNVVIASAGTVNTGDFDDFEALVRLKERYPFYLHVDAAFGAFASLSPELQPLLNGWTCADSICVDLHKWLNVPYDSAVAFTRHRTLQVDVFSNVSAYLGHTLDEPEPIHLAPENSHRWRALPAWFTLAAYGADGYREIIERDCRLARALGERIHHSERFELLAPVRLNIVCFALHNPARTPHFIEAVRNSGMAFVTPTVLWGVPAIRAAFSNWRTTEDDLDIVWDALTAAASKLS